MDTVSSSQTNRTAFQARRALHAARWMPWLVRSFVALVFALAAGSALAQTYPDPLVNSAQVTLPANTTDPVAADNTAEDSNALAASADLSIVKTLTSATPAPAGSTVTYQIVVTNPGPSDAPGATISDTVPPQLLNVSWSCAAAGTSICNTASGTGNVNLTADISAGAANTITITVSGTAPASGTIAANTATVTPPAGTTDPNPGDNTSTTPAVPVAAISDLSVVKALTSASPAPAGSTVTYQIVVNNAGPSDATGATITDTVPAQLSSVSWTCVAAGTSSCGTPGGTGDVNLTATVAAGAGNTITINVTGTAPASGTIGANTVTITPPGGTTDPVPGDNTSTTPPIPVASVSDLSVVKTLTSASPAPAGSTVTYQIVVSNAGPSDATGATITDTVPAQLSSVSWTCVAAGTSSCGTPGGTGDVNLTATVAAGAGNTITISVTGTAPASGTIGANTVAIVPPGGTTDPDPGDNTDTVDPVPVTPIVSIDSASAAEGDAVVFTVSLSGPSASDVTVTLNTADGTAVAPGDYTAQAGVVVTIPAGSVTATVSVPTIEDTLFEGNETFTATISNPSGATIGTATGTGTITDDEAAPTLSIDDVTVNESAGSATFTVTLSGASATAVTVDYATANGTAIAGSDYTDTIGTLTFAPGTLTQTVTVPITNDALFEGSETYNVDLSNATVATIADGSGLGTITDDETTPVVSIDSPNALEGDAMVFTVSLSNASATDVTVSLDTGNGSAVAPGDYTAQAAFLVTIPAGSTSATVNVPTIEDALFEGDETFSATISNPSGATIGTATGTGTIADDEAQPSVSIDSAGATEGSPVAFTVSLSGTSATDVTVVLTTANGTAVAPNDYTAQSGITVTIPAGSTSVIVNVPTSDDALFEGSETFTATLSAPTGATLGTATGTGTITDNDAAPVVSISGGSAAEGSAVVFTVSLSAASAIDTTVLLDTGDGSAVAPGDYTAQAALLVTIPAGSTSATVSVPTVDDALFEGDETFTATISNPTGATLGTAVATGTITDNDAAPTLSIDDVTVNEAGGTATFTVTLSGASTTTVTVDYASAPGTATAPADFAAASGTLTFAPGTLTQTVTVPIVDDNIDEADETFTVGLANATGAAIGDDSGTGTITDNDGTPTVSIDSPSAPEGDPMVFTVSLSNPSATDVSVVLDTGNGSALAPGDYTAQNALTVTVPAGSTNVTVNVPTIEDTLFEGDETFTATIGSPVGATIGTGTGTATITEDDTPPTVSIDSASATEGDVVVFTVSLSAPSASDVTVTWNTADGSALAPGDYTAQSGITVTIPAGSASATVNVPSIEDALFEGDETFTATISNPIGATLGTATGTGTITDDETAPTLSIDDVTVNESAGIAVFTVTLSNASGTAVTVAYATANGTATAGSDYTATTGTLSFAPGVLTQTITVPITNDALFEGSETYTVDLSSATVATIADGSGTGTITDDETTPVVSIDSPSALEGDPMVFTVSLSNPSTTPVTVTLNTANGSAVAPGDYTAQATLLVTIPAGSTSVTVNVPTIEDALFEGDETFTATISAPSGATLGTPTGTATITEDDALPVISVADTTVIEGGVAHVVVSLSSPSATDVTVVLDSSDGTATSPVDYSAQAGIIVTIPAGSISATVPIPTAADAFFEGNEAFTVTLSSPTGATLGDPAATVTITDDEAIPALSIDDVTVSESAGSATFTVTLSGVAAAAVTVGYATANGTAIAGSDYTAITGTLTFAPGTLTQTITVPIIDDALFEASETFNVNLSNATIATIADSSGLGTITNDDMPVIDAVDDTAGPVPGSGGTNVVNVLTNDTLGGAPADPADVVFTPTSSSPLTINPDGSVDVAPDTPAGTYTATYQICERLNPANCDTATVTVTVAAAAIVANDDSAGPVPGLTGGTNVTNALTNDTLGGAPVDLADVVFTPTSSSPLTINPDGSVDVAPDTPAGTYTATYQICERLNPANCDTATVTVTVAAAAIVANDDSAGPVPGLTGGTNVTNALTNDTLGGAPVDLADVVFTPTSSSPLTINPDGSVDVVPNTPAGTYTAAYRICERLNPANCDTATVTVTVAAAPIDAIDDDATATPVHGGNGGMALGSVLPNDTLDGAGTSTGNVLLSFVSATHPGIMLDTSTAEVRVAANTPAGTYALTYRICERLNPANCDTAVVSVMVAAAVIDAIDDTTSVDGASGGTAVIGVLGNDTTDGSALNPAAITLTSTPAGPLTIRPDGSLDVAPNTPAGTYTIPYRICENLNPGNCDIATVTVTVTGEVAALRITKRAMQRTAKVGELVRYTITADNVSPVNVVAVNLVDAIPAGFAYVDGSLAVDDDDNGGNLAGTSPLTVAGIDLAPGRQATITYYLRVGAGVGPGIHTNRAVMQNASGQAVSNVATADVEVAGDPLFDDSLILGTVFDDRNGNGIQDTGERGVPGVRIASIEGLIAETDAFGRYHLAGIPAGSFSRGRLFILKVDPSTLPAGTTFTTENPRVRRITPGLPVRFDFGVKLPEAVMEGGSRQVDIELGEVIFARNSAAIPADSGEMLDRIADTVRKHGGGRISIVARGAAESLAFQRAQAVQAEIGRRLDAAIAGRTRIDVTTEVEPLEPLISLDRAIGLSRLLFDTDKADIRPQYRDLIRHIALAINERGHGELRINGHADARGNAEHNMDLSMRRARAVFDAIARELRPAVRERLRVDITTPNGAVAGAGSR